MGKKRTQLELDGIESGFVRLCTKPTARLSYSFIPQPSGRTGRHSKRLLVFLSGIDNSQTIWQGTLKKLVSLSRINGFDLPPMLVYDRYGAGSSDHDPSDAGNPPEQYHDAVESMHDLRQLIIQIAPIHLGLAENELHDLRIIFCAYSIGCCIARFYADAYPGTVEALLLIDSATAGTAIENMMPNPDIPEEWEKGRLFLPEGTTADQCRDAIRKGRNSPFSGHAITTRERIRWDNMPQFLPSSERPKLRGPEPGMPLVAVVNSDAEVAISSIANMLQLSLPLLRATWQRIALEYKAGLVHLQGKGVGKGPVTAQGCSHNVPREAPELVARELFELLVASSKMVQSRI